MSDKRILHFLSKLCLTDPQWFFADLTADDPEETVFVVRQVVVVHRNAFVIQDHSGEVPGLKIF